MLFLLFYSLLTLVLGVFGLPQYEHEWAPRSPSPDGTMWPATHPEIDRKSQRRLKPSRFQHLYYTDTGKADFDTDHRFTWLRTVFRVPVVIIDQSDHVVKTSCIDGGLRMIFDDQEAMDTAKAWDDTGDFLLITKQADCGEAERGQRSFWMVDELKFDDKSFSVDAVCHEVDPQDAIDNADVSWGRHKAPKGTTLKARDNAPACGKPPAKTIRGLPAAACGPNFDRELDDRRGYLQFDPKHAEQSLKDIVPGLPSNPNLYNTDDITKRAPDPNGSLAPQSEHDLDARGFFSSLWTNVVSLAKKVGSDIKEGLKKANPKKWNWQAIKKKANEIIFKVGGTLKSGKIDQTLERDIPVSWLADDDGTSPWSGRSTWKLWDTTRKGELHNGSAGGGEGDGGCGGTIYIYGKGDAALYLVDTGVNGNFHLEGRLLLNLRKLTADVAYLTLVGDMKAALNLGIHLDATFRAMGKVDLETIPIPPPASYKVPGILSLGLELTGTAVAKASIHGESSTVFGYALTFPNLTAHLDLKNIKKSKLKGEKPTGKFGLDFKTEINANFDIEVEPSLGIGLSIFKWKWKAALESSLNMNADFTRKDSGSISSKRSDDLNRGEIEGGGGGGGEHQVTAIARRDSDGEGCRNRLGASMSWDIGYRLSLGDYSEKTALFNWESDKYSECLDDGDPNNGNVRGFIDDIKALTGDDPVAQGLVYKKIEAKVGDAIYQLKSTLANNFALSTEEVASIAEAEMFALYRGVTATDSSQHVFWYYPDEMEAYGVSRFRTGPLDEVPVGADMVALAPTEGSQGSLGVFSTNSNSMFIPIACNLAQGLTKIFVAKDLEQGRDVLTGNTAVYTVTGGDVEKCDWINLVESKDPDEEDS